MSPQGTAWALGASPGQTWMTWMMWTTWMRASAGSEAPLLWASSRHGVEPGTRFLLSDSPFRQGTSTRQEHRGQSGVQMLPLCLFPGKTEGAGKEAHPQHPRTDSRAVCCVALSWVRDVAGTMLFLPRSGPEPSCEGEEAGLNLLLQGMGRRAAEALTPGARGHTERSGCAVAGHVPGAPVTPLAPNDLAPPPPLFRVFGLPASWLPGAPSATRFNSTAVPSLTRAPHLACPGSLCVHTHPCQ